jgi:hypothetical protein
MLDVPPELQPAAQPFTYPAHNQDWGVEQDFLAYLHSHPEQKASSNRADWHYLPVFWTRWHLNHDYASTGLDELQRLVASSLLDDAKTFTVCQYDDGPVVDVGETTLLLASRKTDAGLDIPLLSAPHRRPWLPVRRRWLASFVGRLSTHPVRQELADALDDHPGVRIVDGDFGSRRFVRTSLASNVVLSPRGYGGSSFRFFEAAQLGRTPMLIGDLDTRPFPGVIDWSRCSLYASTGVEAAALLDTTTPAEANAMGTAVAATWRESLTWGRWCPLAIEELALRGAIS